MAVAGKVAITLSEENNGKWSASVTYDKLVAVTHNNNLYISKKASTNEEPTVTNEFWFLALEGFSGETFDGILDGTIAVGNALKLGGHGAEYFAPLSELANYLKNTGGTVNGNFIVKGLGTGAIFTRVANDTRNVYQHIDGNGLYQLYDGTNNKEIVRSTEDGTNTFNGTASGNLPLTGGIVTKNGTKVMGIHNTNSVYTLFEFYGQGSELGSIGFDGVNNLVFIPVESGTKNILHTGNKPTGSYTGNGDATSRTINVGGINAGALVVRNSNYSTLVFDSGAISIDGNGTITGIPYKEAHYTNNVLTLATTNVALNQNGTTNTYYVL